MRNIYSGLIFLPLAFLLLILKAYAQLTDICDIPLGDISKSRLNGDNYGEAVAVCDLYAAVGSPGYLLDEGAVYMYLRDEFAMYSEVQVLQASDLVAGDNFGSSLTFDDSGTRMAVSAPFQNLYAGAVYAFVLTGDVWSENTKCIPADVASFVEFGHKQLAMDGTMLVAGALGDSSIRSGNGAIYVFTESSLNNNDWVETAKLTCAETPTVDEFFFGRFLALHGSIMVAGAPNLTPDNAGLMDRTGAVFVYTESVGVWDDQSTYTRLTASDGGPSEDFGQAVSINEFYIAASSLQKTNLVGDTFAGCVYVFFEYTPGSWSQQSVIWPDDTGYYSFFGGFLALNGNSIAVTILQDPTVSGEQKGALYVFEELSESPQGDPTGPGNWLQMRKIRPDVVSEDDFGQNIDFSGNLVIGGAKRGDPSGSETSSGHAFLFHIAQEDCTGTGRIGRSCCLACENGTPEDASTNFQSCDCSGMNLVGVTCDKSCNNGIASDDFTVCNCTLSGADKTYCTRDIDDCASNPCLNTGVCTDLGSVYWPHHNNEFNCTCDGTGYEGPTCEISKCGSSPCLNDGMCEQVYDVNGPIGVQCNCSNTDYEGDWCQTEVDECASSPCLNDGECTDLLGDFTCDCASTGYEGLICSEDVDDCLSSPCQNDGTCQDKGANKFKCTCDEFWEGDTCSDDVDDCLLTVNECLNGGACEDDPVNMGDVICTCIVEDGGFTGKYCDVPIEDACVTFNPCANGGKCILDDITKAMSCDCRDTGYEGDVCDVQVYVSECVSSPCLNEGQCYDPSDQQDDWYCECTGGYFGDLCDTTACDSNPCHNGGTCIDVLDGSYTCACPENFAGAQCQINDDGQVGFTGSDSSSSSSSPAKDDGNVDSGDSTTNNSSDAVLIIIIVVVVVVAGGALAFVVFKRRQQKTSFLMPT